MPKSAADQMQRQIEYGKQGIDEVIESLSHVDSARATAWKLEDETKVKLDTKFVFLSDLMFQGFRTSSKKSCSCQWFTYLLLRKSIFLPQVSSQLRKSLIQELCVRFRPDEIPAVVCCFTRFTLFLVN